MYSHSISPVPEDYRRENSMIMKNFAFFCLECNDFWVLKSGPGRTKKVCFSNSNASVQISIIYEN